MTNDLRLGERVSIRARLEREFELRDNRGYKLWRSSPLPKPVEGIVVGVRMLSNGKRDLWNEEGYVYKPQEFFKAALVATSLRGKPFFTNFDSLTALKDVAP